MKKLQVLGTGCTKCMTLAANIEVAAKELGIAYEIPYTERKDIIQNRLTVDLIIRY